jgi:hypothetical protein
MILSSTTKFIILASNTGRCGRLTGNGKFYRLPGRNTFATNPRREKSVAPAHLRGLLYEDSARHRAAAREYHDEPEAAP